MMRRILEWAAEPDVPAAISWGLRCLLLTAFALPFSIALAQATASLTLAVWAADSIQRRSTGLLRNPYLIPVVLFGAVAVWSAFNGWRPQISLPKLHRLLWFLLIAAIPDLAARDRRGRVVLARRIITALTAGACAAALLHIVKLIPAMARVPEGMDPTFWLFHQGSMRTPQFHMVVLLILLSGLGGAWMKSAPRTAAAAIALNAAGLILHFKRGVWGSFLGGALLIGGHGRRIRGRTAGLAALAIALLFCIPVVRQRVADAPRDFMGGGRWDLWTRAAPRLLKKAPDGIGYSAMSHRDLRGAVRGLEPKIDHLHNNALQVLVELGWPGLVVWSGWMAYTLALMAGVRRRLAAAGGDGETLARGLLAATCGLLLNGVIEVNFNAGAILMLFALLMGVSVALRDAAPCQPKTGELKS